MEDKKDSITIYKLATKWKDSLTSDEYFDIIENVIAPNVKLQHDKLLWLLIFLSKEIEEYPFQMKCYYLQQNEKELIPDESIDSIIEQLLHKFKLTLKVESILKIQFAMVVNLLLSLKLNHNDCFKK